MRKLFKGLAAVAVAMSWASLVMADDVILTDGEHLSGTISKITDGKLALHSAVLGDLAVPLDHVQTFSTQSPVEIHMADGTVISQSVAESDAGLILAGGQKLTVANIDAVNPNGLSGSFLIGGSLVRGNTFTDTFAAGVKLGYVYDAEKLSFAGEYDYGKQKTRTIVTPAGGAPFVTETESTTTDRWDAYAKYQHFFTKKFYGYIDADVTKDRIANLDLRFAPTAGVGYQWFDKAPFTFGTEVGVGWLYQKYTNGTPTHQPLDFKAAYHLTYDFNSNVSLFNDLTYYPTVPRVADYLITADLGLHAKLTTKLFAELKVEWDYNSNPANLALKNDTRYIASLGYSI